MSKGETWPDWGLGPAPTMTGEAPAAVVDEVVPIIADDIAGLRRIPLDQLFESEHNPRQYFDAAQLAELADSLKTGQLTPCLVRPRAAGGYEFAAGHRRFRAAKLAGLDSLLCLVQPMDDARFLEVLVVENDQRADVHPLEEARGYRTLMEQAGYDVPAIASRVGRSVKYVYDRMKLLSLTKEAQQLFLAGRFEAGHAILLARLTPADQKRALDTVQGGVFEVENADDVDEDGHRLQGEQRAFGALIDGGRGQKPVSVRELASWINEEVRLPKDALDPMLFPESAGAVEEAEKVVQITRSYQVRPEAKDPTERIYGPLSWKPAEAGMEYREERTGAKRKGRTCEHAVLGVVVVGDGRGEAFKVCIAKQKCGIHWPKPKTEPKEASEKDKAASWEEKQRRERERYEQQAKERDERVARWKKAIPAIRAAAAKRVDEVPVALCAALVAEFCQVSRQTQADVARGVLKGDALLRRLAFGLLEHAIGRDWTGGEDFAREHGKRFGVNVKKILEEAEGAAAKPVAKKAPAKKGKGKS